MARPRRRHGARRDPSSAAREEPPGQGPAAGDDGGAATANPGLVYAQLVLGTGLWGGVFVFGELAVRGLAPVYVAFVRYFLATIGLILLVRLTGRRLSWPGRDLPLLVLLGITGVWIYNILFFLGLQLSSASHGAILIATSPIWTVGLAALLIGERMSLARAVGLVLGVAGVVLVVGGDVAPMGSDSMLGDLCFLGAALCWAGYSLLGKRALTRYSASQATAYASIIGTLLLLPVAAAAGFGSNLRATEAMDWIGIFYMATFGTVVAFVLWYRGVGALGPSRTSIFLNLVPLWGVGLAALFLGQSITLVQLVGMIAIIAGVRVVQITR